MAGNVDKNYDGELPSRTTSFSGKHPQLGSDTPASFQRAPSSRREFDQVRDPYYARQMKVMELTEAQRRGDSERTGRGSEMVKLNKPFPELRPKSEQIPIRETFNRAWLREQREARLNDLERQRAKQQFERSDRSMHEDWEEKRQQQRGLER
ncbi:hypothetical protein ABF87_08030 [Nitrosomonas sp. JL21]|uniref:hypothetical protein n=1 Tax=Nitrosomonas sp. JL21 TaxID=153949 RepID=UPI00136C9548|nr:hypothetical protein [Nitrosomonas sp. JL21]MXS77912.1 hypothetical protein [Nitrosomonas sp. JL21]